MTISRAAQRTRTCRPRMRKSRRRHAKLPPPWADVNVDVEIGKTTTEVTPVWI
ncbi:hypothetical protein [Thiospirillum jenense]|uniref:Uncharacterized protein n=1 Tax=Thiospirillum jenense TaxID=1653858 RepID=A0A839H5R8_9GAMM|nr:hypothetical protein [Thiospirillum jenense]MBB1125253.1 hypothetical protein [Thiospirillum jenense]